MAKKLLTILLIRMLFFPAITGLTMKADVYAQQKMSEDLALGSFVQGVGDNRFAPDNNVTREEIAVKFYRTLQAVSNARQHVELHTTYEQAMLLAVRTFEEYN